MARGPFECVCILHIYCIYILKLWEASAQQVLWKAVHSVVSVQQFCGMQCVQQGFIQFRHRMKQFLLLIRKYKQFFSSLPMSISCLLPDSTHESCRYRHKVYNSYIHIFSRLMPDCFVRHQLHQPSSVYKTHWNGKRRWARAMLLSAITSKISIHTCASFTHTARDRSHIIW